MLTGYYQKNKERLVKKGIKIFGEKKKTEIEYILMNVSLNMVVKDIAISQKMKNKS